MKYFFQNNLNGGLHGGCGSNGGSKHGGGKHGGRIGGGRIGGGQHGLMNAGPGIGA